MRARLLFVPALFLALLTGETRAAEQLTATVKDAPKFVQLDPITMAVIGDNNRSEQISVVLSLELAAGHDREIIAVNKQKLVDAFFRNLTEAYEQAAPDSRVFDALPIKQRLLEASNQVLGAGTVTAVLIQQINERSRSR
jgi:hypothetical protein